jgi:hypothetical protein
MASRSFGTRSLTSPAFVSELRSSRPAYPGDSPTARAVVHRSIWVRFRVQRLLDARPHRLVDMPRDCCSSTVSRPSVAQSYPSGHQALAVLVAFNVFYAAVGSSGAWPCTSGSVGGGPQGSSSGYQRVWQLILMRRSRTLAAARQRNGQGQSGPGSTSKRASANRRAETASPPRGPSSMTDTNLGPRRTSRAPISSWHAYATLKAGSTERCPISTYRLAPGRGCDGDHRQVANRQRPWGCQFDSQPDHSGLGRAPACHQSALSQPTRARSGSLPTVIDGDPRMTVRAFGVLLCAVSALFHHLGCAAAPSEPRQGENTKQEHNGQRIQRATSVPRGNGNSWP